MALTGKVCLVTGGTRGIGRGIALQLGGAGATVYVTGRTLKKKEGMFGSLEDTAEEIESRGGKCVPVLCDHSDPEQIRTLFEQINREQDSRLDILVNNAYAAVNAIIEQHGVPFWEQPESMWDTVNNVGLKNHYLCTVHACKMMVPRGQGLIVNVSSAGGLSYFLNVPYGIGKAALDRMSADCAVELRKKNVTVVTLWPGYVQTEVTQEAFRDGGKNVKEGFSALSVQQLATGFQTGETTECAGMAVRHLATDPNIHKKTGKIVMTGELATEYGFKDVDGREVRSFRSLKVILSATGWKRTAAMIPSWVKIPFSALTLGTSKF